MRTIEEIFKEADSRGLLVNNLYQLRTHPAHPNTPAKATREWQANFIHSTGFHDSGRGPSAAEALEDALERAKGKRGPENRPIPKAPSAVRTDAIPEDPFS